MWLNKFSSFPLYEKFSGLVPNYAYNNVYGYEYTLTLGPQFHMVRENYWNIERNTKALELLSDCNWLLDELSMFGHPSMELKQVEFYTAEF